MAGRGLPAATWGISHMAPRKRKRKRRPTLGGVPLDPIMEVKKGECIAGMWVSDPVPEIGSYKLLSKRKADGSCEWVHFVQRPNGYKDRFFRGTVENESRLQDVVDAINKAFGAAYGADVKLHPADADIYPVDGVTMGKTPDKLQ